MRGFVRFVEELTTTPRTPLWGVAPVRYKELRYERARLGIGLRVLRRWSLLYTLDDMTEVSPCKPQSPHNRVPLILRIWRKIRCFVCYQPTLLTGAQLPRSPVVAIDHDPETLENRLYGWRTPRREVQFLPGYVIERSCCCHAFTHLSFMTRSTSIGTCAPVLLTTQSIASTMIASTHSATSSAPSSSHSRTISSCAAMIGTAVGCSSRRS